MVNDLPISGLRAKRASPTGKWYSTSWLSLRWVFSFDSVPNMVNPFLSSLFCGSLTDDQNGF